jgi:predicted RNA binding protein YcfA (HicA-like mRNA interferase family)
MAKEVKYREIERFLLDQGWRVLRTRGSHEIWGGPNGAGRLTTPRHGTVSPGVVRDVIQMFPNAPKSWR